MIPRDLFFHKCQNSTTQAGSELRACANKSWFLFVISFVLSRQMNVALIIFEGRSPLDFTGPIYFANKMSTTWVIRTGEGNRVSAFSDIPRGHRKSYKWSNDASEWTQGWSPTEDTSWEDSVQMAKECVNLMTQDWRPGTPGHSVIQGSLIISGKKIMK